MKKLITLSLLLILFIISCGPQTKDDYMTEFDLFMEEVSKNHKQFKRSDWKAKSSEFGRLSNDYYKQFEPELSLRDKAVISKYRVKYLAISTRGELRNALKSKEIKELKDEVKKYKEEEFEEDVDMIKKDVEEMGKSAKKFLKDIYDDIE